MHLLVCDIVGNKEEGGFYTEQQGELVPLWWLMLQTTWTNTEFVGRGARQGSLILACCGVRHLVAANLAGHQSEAGCKDHTVQIGWRPGRIKAGRDMLHTF